MRDADGCQQPCCNRDLLRRESGREAPCEQSALHVSHELFLFHWGFVLRDELVDASDMLVHAALLLCSQLQALDELSDLTYIRMASLNSVERVNAGQWSH